MTAVAAAAVSLSLVLALAAVTMAAVALTRLDRQQRSGRRGELPPTQILTSLEADDELEHSSHDRLDGTDTRGDR